ncbi:MAG: lysylphosphatidylglycerol synthase transmembrane domain-containing protein, partial [Myxococcota bacterium]
MAVNYWGKVFFGVAVTIALLWWALSSVPFSDVLASMRAANPWLLLAASVVMTAGSLIRAMRWKVFLTAVKPDTSLHSRFASVSIHFMANNILPLRVGEFARAWVFGRLESVQTSAAFGSLVVERFMDAVVLLCFLVLPVFSSGFPNESALFEGWGGLVLRAGVGIVLSVLVALIVMVAFPRRFIALARRLVPMLPDAIGRKGLGALESFLGSLSVLRDPKLVALGFLWSFFFWTWHSAAFWLGMLAFDIDIGI